MSIALWIVQGVLCALFLMAGTMKAVQSKEKLSRRLPWVNNVPDWTVKMIGVLELAAALGLILPMVTGILPWLTPVAGVGLVFTMIGAIVFHARRQEIQAIGFNTVLLLLALFVAYGRFILVPVVA